MHEARYRTIRHNPRSLHTVRRVAPISGEHLVYTDRKLGVSETVATSASTIHHFTGNNIGPKGDLASRALVVRLEVDRADPENRGGIFMFAVSSSRRKNTLLVLQAIQHGRHWAKREARS